MIESTNQNGIFKITQIIYGAFMFAVIGFLIVAFYLIDNPIFTVDINDIFTIAVPVVAISSVFLSNLLYVKTMDKIPADASLNSKLTQYQTATIIKGATLEAPALLATVAAFISNNISFLLISLILAIIMYLKFPKKEKFKEEVRLSFAEKSELDKL